MKQKSVSIVLLLININKLLKNIGGNNVGLLEEMKERFKDDPREVTSHTFPNGKTIIRVGELNVKLLAKKALEKLF